MDASDMNASDWIAIAAALVSVAAIVIASINRRGDIKRENAFFWKARVTEVLNGEPGIRSVEALDEADDDKAAKRVSVLERTATQLDLANAPDLAKKLRETLGKDWGSKTNDDSRESRKAFHAAVKKFMSS